MMRPICIVDDDEDVREVMSFAFEFEGIHVKSLANGKVALDYLGQLPPEEYPCLIILDYMMPEMNGLEFIREVKKKHSQTIGKIPIVLNTARGSVHSEENLPQDIMILGKPTELSDLIEVGRKFSHLPSL